MPRLLHARFWYALGLLLTLLVIVVCLVPQRDLPRMNISDKIEHALAYVALTLWFGGLFRPRSYGWIALWMLVLGAGIEIAQGLMGLGRTADIRDFYADAAGVAAGLALALIGLRHWVAWLEWLWQRRP